MTDATTLDELLSRTTYQGMTDDEIERIIDYRVEQRLGDANFAEERKTFEVFSTSLLETAAQNKAASDALLQRAFDSAGVNLQVASPDTVEPEGVSPHVA